MMDLEEKIALAKTWGWHVDYEGNYDDTDCLYVLYNETEFARACAGSERRAWALILEDEEDTWQRMLTRYGYEVT